MSDTLANAFAQQATACDGLGSPFMARLMRVLPALLPQDTALARRLADWSGDVGPSGASLPLRLAGGLHYLVLDGRDTALRAVWPPLQGPGLPEAVAQALREHDGFLTDWITHAPQTNEVGRSAVLIAAAAEVGAAFGLPLCLSELGASAGLNLNFPLYGLQAAGMTLGPDHPALTLTPDWRGRAPLPLHPAAVEARGVDLNPLSPASDGMRLLSYVWPDQAERLARMRAALAVAADHPPVLDRADAADWLGARLASPRSGCCHLVYHTIAYQYFPPATQARIAAMMARAGAAVTAQAPLAWLAMEADEVKGSAAVTLQLWPGARRVTLARAGFHGQWVDWAGL